MFELELDCFTARGATPIGLWNRLRWLRWDGYGGESWFVGEERDLKFWCALLKISLFHSPIGVAPRAVKQSNSSSNINMLVFSNTWDNMCKYIYIGV